MSEIIYFLEATMIYHINNLDLSMSFAYNTDFG